MNTFILTFDILRTSEELTQLNALLGEKNFCPIGVNCHAYLIRFEGSASDLRQYLIHTESVYSYEVFFIAEVQKWSAELRGNQRMSVPRFLGSRDEYLAGRLLFA